jgi:HEAT repeat protein
VSDRWAGEPLGQNLWVWDYYVRAKIRAEEAVTPLSKALEDANEEVRQQAAFALGQIRNAQSVPWLSIEQTD